MLPGKGDDVVLIDAVAADAKAADEDRALIERRAAGKKDDAVLIGDVVRIVVGGGGGFGSAADRPVSAVLSDIQEGKMTAAAALNTYPQSAPYLAKKRA